MNQTLVERRKQLLLGDTLSIQKSNLLSDLIGLYNDKNNVSLGGTSGVKTLRVNNLDSQAP